VLLGMNRPAEALKQFDRELELYTGRSAALMGAARANSKLGQEAAAIKFYSEVLKNWRNADPTLPGMEEARRGVSK